MINRHVEEFAKAEFPGYLLINFKYASKEVKETFEEYLDKLDQFFQRLFLETGKKPLPQGILIIFDEVQAYPSAREAIKVRRFRRGTVAVSHEGCEGIRRGEVPSVVYGCMSLN